MPKNQVYGVVLPVDLAQQARVVAALQDKSRSKLMRELLTDYLNKFSSYQKIGNGDTVFPKNSNLTPDG